MDDTNTQMDNNLLIVQTEDGSNTIFNNLIGENYHSKHGALQESKHVFLESGLKYYLDQSSLNFSNISILEVGFGTGLNFMLTADYCTENRINLFYTGIEAYPLNAVMIGQTGYNGFLTKETWETFIQNYNSALRGSILLNEYCNLAIAPIKLIDFENDQQFDIIYYDAFASTNQPEMWNELAIAHTIKFLKPGGLFVTYAITGNLKRMLKALGCTIQKAPGAPGKREMLRAFKMI